ncbi:MAG: VOC family protein [Pseudomonadota bacterium]
MTSHTHSGLEHVNLTVPHARKSARMFAEVFGWQVRWEGAAINDGYSIHVGNETSYLALYSPGDATVAADINKARAGHLNHIGIVVDDLDAVEVKVKTLGYTPYSHGDYEPGRRFYFDDENGLEIEVVSYT